MTPQYYRLAELLRQDIMGGKWAPGEMLPPIRRLAEQYRIGLRPMVKAMGLLKREGVIGLNVHRRLEVLSSRSSLSIANTIVVEVMSDHLGNFLTHPLYCELQRGLQLGAGSCDRSLLITHNPRFISEMPADLFALDPRGIVLVGKFTNATLGKYERLAIPVVLADRPRGNRQLHAVAAENHKSSVDVVARLCSNGHKRIAFVRYLSMGLCDVDPDSQERQKGFFDGLLTAGIPQRTCSIFSMTNLDKADCAPLRALFRTRPRFTAVVAVDDVRARHIEKAASIYKRRIPDDLSLVCFQPHIGAPAPHISGPRFDFSAMGRCAFDLTKDAKQRVREIRISAIWSNGLTLAPIR